MSDVLFGGGKALHRALLNFAGQSARTFQFDGESYTIHHSQYARFPLRDLFITLVEETEADPREDEGFDQEATDAVVEAACYRDLRDQHFYNPREYVDESDIRGAARDYCTRFYKLADSMGDRYVGDVQAETRREAIAEVLTLMNSKEAEMQARVQGITGDADDDDVLDPGVNHEKFNTAVRHVTLNEHGPSVFRRPDPSLRLSQQVYELYDDAGKNPVVREVYGFLVSASDDSDFQPDRNLKSSPINLGGDSMRWTSKSEPPLKSLESYNR